MNKRAGIFLATAAFWGGQALAETPAPISDTELSKDTENPVTRQITVPLRYEADFLDGAYKATKGTAPPSGSPAARGTWSARRVGRAAAPARPWLPGSHRSRSAPMAAARSAARLPAAG